MSAHQEFFDALLDPERPSPAGLTTWNGSDPATRFAVYRNNVMVSLVDALADTFPVTQELVGEEFFRAMAQVFVRAQPPRSRLLTVYGEPLPDFIEQFPPAASVPYLADVARLEMMRVHAYHAPDAAGLCADAIAQTLANAGQLADLSMTLHPSARLLLSRYAVVSLWAAHQGLVDISSVDPYRPENALIIRPDLDVEVISLDDGAGQFVSCLLQGACLDQAAEQASLVGADFDLPGILATLIRQRALSSITTTRKTQP